MATDDTSTNTDSVGDTTPDDLLALALARGKTIAAAAREAGIDRKTVYRRREEPEFRQRVEHFRRMLVEQAVNLLSDAMTAAASRMVKLGRSKNEAIALGACSRLLDLGLRAHELRDLTARLDALEQCAREQAERKR